MSAIHIVRDYPYPVELVWRAVTDPEQIPRWTATGAGARPEGFTPEIGTGFRFVAQPRPGWSGVVHCTVLDVEAPNLLRYSWQDAGGGAVTEVSYLLEARAAGTRFTYDHVGFAGIGGLLMSQVLGRVRRTMLTVGLPPVLEDLEASPTT